MDIARGHMQDANERKEEESREVLREESFTEWLAKKLFLCVMGILILSFN
jgi:hypothetical protein